MPTTPISKVLGTLIGGAVGDAMGAPFEGLWGGTIPEPDALLEGYHEYEGYPRGQYTDDTQLTLVTIESIVDHGDVVVADIARRIAELWRHQSVVGPGGACTQAAEKYLATGSHQQMGAPVGQAGNGTAMRTAALGLWFGEDRDSLVAQVADVSRLTHQDPRSIAGGVAVALACSLLASDSDATPAAFCQTLANGCRAIDEQLAELLCELPTRMGDEDVLSFVANAGQVAPEFDDPIITPYVVPTVLASIYCMLEEPGSWTEAVTTAVRLGGDVDTLGAIVGALAGAKHGYDAVPEHLAKGVHNSPEIHTLARRYAGRIASGS